jgi:hypothetical protein
MGEFSGVEEKLIVPLTDTIHVLRIVTAAGTTH